MKHFLPLFLAIALCLCATNRATSQVVSGTTGSCSWQLTGSSGNYILTISGNGAMENYSNSSNVPWYSYRNSITTVDIQQGVTTIGRSAFSDCSGLMSVTIPNSVISIAEYAFYSCEKLTSVNIPNHVTSIEQLTFAFCESLTSITIPESVTTIGKEAFYYCRNLNSISIGNNVTNIGNGSFEECSKLSSVSIGNNVTKIENGLFRNCGNLHYLSMGSGVTSIGVNVFIGCSALISFTCLATTPPELNDLGGHPFAGVPPGVTLYVPAESVETYKTTFYWKIFNITAYVPSAIETLATESGIDIYPNPAADNIYITLPGNVHQAVFTLYDMQGKALMRQSVGNEDTVSVSGIAAGMYIYRISTATGSYSGKLSIEK